MAAEKLHIHEAAPDATCDVHEWSTEEFARRLIPEMRARHGKGGLNVCLDCIERAKASLPPRPR